MSKHLSFLSSLVRELLQQFKPDCRVAEEAMEGLYQATQAYMVDFFHDCNLLALHANRVTIQPRDLQILRVLRGEKQITRDVFEPKDPSDFHPDPNDSLLSHSTAM